MGHVSQSKGAERKAGSQQNETADEQTANNGLQSLNGWQEGKNGLELAKLEIVFLSKIHQSGDRTETESAIGQGQQRCVNASKNTGDFRIKGMRRSVQGGHQGKHAD